jgi:hypothetical protein
MEESAEAEADDDEANDNEADEPDPDVGDAGSHDPIPAGTGIEDNEEPPTPPPRKPVKHNKRTVPVGESCSPFYTSITSVSFLTFSTLDSESEVDDSEGK